MKKKALSLNRWRTFDYINAVILFLLGVITFYPFYNVIILSLNDSQDALRGGIFFYVRKFTLENYLYFFQSKRFFNSFYISVARTVLGSFSATFFTAAFAYGVSKKHLLGRKLFIGLIIFTMYVSGGLIPTFILIVKIGLYENFLVYIIPLLFSSYNAIILMTFFKGFPAEIEESVKIDGANDLTIFIRIVLPIAKPVIATILLFNAVGQWNSWFDSMLYGGEKLVTLQARLVEIIRDAQLSKQLEIEAGMAGLLQTMYSKPTVESVKATAMAVTAIPIVMVYPFLQKYFVKGIMIGSLKG